MVTIMTAQFVKIGRHSRLKVVDKVGFGVFLDGMQFDEILLPKRFVPENCQVGDELDVFVYLDSDDCLIATTEQPLAQVGEFACLTVKQVNQVGAFMDWNLGKDLLCPYPEQKTRMNAGESYVVYLYQDDETRRIVASSKINRFLSEQKPTYKNGQPVSLLVSDRTDLGYMAIINNRHQGLLFDKDIQQSPNPESVTIGARIDGFIKRVRDDGKIDLCLKKPGFDKGEMSDLGQHILGELKASNGYLPFNDKSDPALIKKEFNVSKRVFKMAIGRLYKQRLITIEDKGIRLNQ